MCGLIIINLPGSGRTPECSDNALSIATEMDSAIAEVIFGVAEMLLTTADLIFDIAEMVPATAEMILRVGKMV